MINNQKNTGSSYISALYPQNPKNANAGTSALAAKRNFTTIGAGANQVISGEYNVSNIPIDGAPGVVKGDAYAVFNGINLANKNFVGTVFTGAAVSLFNLIFKNYDYIYSSAGELAFSNCEFHKTVNRMLNTYTRVSGHSFNKSLFVKNANVSFVTPAGSLSNTNNRNTVIGCPDVYLHRAFDGTQSQYNIFENHSDGSTCNVHFVDNPTIQYSVFGKNIRYKIGYSKAITSFTNNGGFVQIPYSGVYYKIGDKVRIDGCSVSAYNGVWDVTSVVISNSSTATGTITLNLPYTSNPVTNGIYQSPSQSFTIYRTIAEMRLLSLPFLQSSDNLQFLKQCISHCFYESQTNVDSFLRGCRMVGAGDYASYTDCGFIDATNENYMLKSKTAGDAQSSIAIGIGYNRENAGKFAGSVSFGFNETTFPLSGRVNLASNGSLVDFNLSGSAKSIIKTFPKSIKITNLRSVANIAFRNNEQLDTARNTKAAVSASPTALTIGARYVVEGNSITHNSVNYNVGDVFDAATTEFTGSGVVREFLYLIPYQNIFVKATTKTFANTGTRDAYFASTLKWCRLGIDYNSGADAMGNYSDGDLIAGELDLVDYNSSDTIQPVDKTANIYNAGTAQSFLAASIQIMFVINVNTYIYKP